MEGKKLYLGSNEVVTSKGKVDGQFVEIDGEKYYQIHNYHNMSDFFMSIVSDSDHWMFISSNGSLSAGRKNRDNSLFPYYTVDKIHDSNDFTGSYTCLLVEKESKTYVWEPFTDDSQKFYHITRNLYKSIYGNSLIFEEVNTKLGITFRYGWYNSEKFGFVKKSSLINHNDDNVSIKVLDGLRNLLPSGVTYNFQNEYSNLLDAYKKNERIEDSSLGLFMLSAIPIDRAEPSEALKTNVVWSTGYGDKSEILISDKQIAAFQNGNDVLSEYDIKASRGAYLINYTIDLESNGTNEWYTVADINKESADVINLKLLTQNTTNIEGLIIEDIKKGTENLQRMVSCADGFQLTNTELCYVRHFSNTLYNIMRGGVFVDGYNVDTSDYKTYLRQINRLVSKEYQSWLDELPAKIAYMDLLKLAEEIGDSDLIRITYEYLPLTFSRRHGDPSRPWNVFSIETKNDDGSTLYNYEGNWRDIFQNWEALCFSYPEYVEGIISKFVNASTIDGYNPYRIMRNGIDWEITEPDDPWAYIGYWGDHQIIYLQKLLELSDDFHPGKIDELLNTEIFTYANVPYRLKSYEEIKKNSKDTVIFDHDLNDKITSEVEYLGADARLLKDSSGDQVYKVNLTEKILASLLSKMSNFIPEAGIWLNTQRPEWNDANNALVGNGTSMVTLYYLRRFLKFWNTKFEKISFSDIAISEELYVLFNTINKVFAENVSILGNGFSDIERKSFTDSLGEAHGKFRKQIYSFSFSGIKNKITVEELKSFTELSLLYIDKSIVANKRDDGLYHAYNLISISDTGISIRNLYEMLEGQVAVLTSGLLTTEESLKVLNSLKNSSMFREDQYSYILYPDRQLPRFLEKNVIPEKYVKESLLLTKLIEDGERSIIQVDNEGSYHFVGTARNADALEESLDKLRVGSYNQLVEEEKERILQIYEIIFDHQSFTGRSGTFYGYEGLGSIYWHMVSKLLLATQECYFKAIKEGANDLIIGQMKDHYYEIKAGIGLYKSPDLYGAFPTDAYSHTPANSGVKQPGLTGQVKEDIISRNGEMGVRIKEGKIVFETSLFNDAEILDKSQLFEYYSPDGNKFEIELKENQIGFTCCQVPIVYKFSDNQSITTIFNNGTEETVDGNTINEVISNKIFNRSCEIKLVEVTIIKNKNVI